MGNYGLLLSALLPDIPFEREYSLAAHTSIGVGGTANAFFPQTAGQLRALVRLCGRCRIPFFPLGAGSNVLPPDGEYGGVILATRHFDRCAAEGRFLTAECGVSVARLLAVCKRRGLRGLEFVSGIPATVGGLTVMNAGTGDGHVGDRIESVTCLQEGKLQTYTAVQCRFACKDSVFQHFPCVILSVRFRQRESTPAAVEEAITLAANKRRHLPVGRSMGCVFKNPTENVSAGRLIEESGCKGWREGNAVVSERHANFILNRGGATAAQIRTLIGRVRRQVYARTGVLLQEEIRYIQQE